MKKKILIDGNYLSQTRIVLADSSNKIEELDYETGNLNQIKSNIYLARVVRVEPGLQAVFIDYGAEKNGFLPFNEIHPDYFSVPNDQSIPKTENFSEIKIGNVNFTEDLNQTENVILSTSDLELDISTIEKFIDEDIQTQLNEEVSENDLEEIVYNEEQKIIKIQDVIKKGQFLLVQAQKEERGNKGASFTTHISLAGKYNVLIPSKKDSSGISRRISSVNERRRLKEILKIISDSIQEPSPSVIIRTAGFGRSAEEIYKDYEYLVRLWNQIRKIAVKSKIPCFIHIEDGIINKTIRDYFDSKVESIIVQGAEAYDVAKEFMQNILPDEIGKLKLYDENIPIFTKYNIESQISDLYQQIMYLPSGGYIVINPTEALTSIDVNSGKSTQEKNIEETALKTNLEAAKEISRSLKLRDISGLIVIDFIDMSVVRNRKIVERSLKEFLARDKAKIQIGTISNFGLLEMSRQRLRSTFLEVHSKMCKSCNGKGVVRSNEPNAMLILRTIENEIYNTNSDIINIYSSQEAILYLLNHKRIEISQIEEIHGVKLNFLIDPTENSDGFSIEQVTLPVYNGKNIFNKNKEIIDKSSFEQENKNPVDNNSNKKPKPKNKNKNRNKNNSSNIEVDGKNKLDISPNEKNNPNNNLDNNIIKNQNNDLDNSNISISDVNVNPDSSLNEEQKKITAKNKSFRKRNYRRKIPDKIES